HLDEDGEEEPQQQQVTDDPPDVWQTAAEDEQREEAAAERGERNAPAGEPCQRLLHPAGSTGPALGRTEPLGDPPRDLVALEHRDAVEYVAGCGVDAEVGADEVERARADRAVEPADLWQHTRDGRGALGDRHERVDGLGLAEPRQRGHVTFSPGGRAWATATTARLPSL